MKTLLILLAGHALCDYPLQGDFLAKAKNRAAPIPGVPWYQALGAHALIHGGMVALATGSTRLGVADNAILYNIRFAHREAVAHLSDAAVINAYDDFYWSEMYGDNDARFPEFIKEWE